MKRLSLLFLVIFASVIINGCESEYKRTMERQRKMSGDWENDVAKWKKGQEKPTKPIWEREHKENR